MADEKIEVSPKVALFLTRIDQNSQVLHVDAKAGGLSEYGESLYNSNLQTLAIPIVHELVADSVITEAANAFMSQLAPDMEGGTCEVTLNESERGEFLHLLADQGITFGPLVNSIINTTVLV